MASMEAELNGFAEIFIDHDCKDGCPWPGERFGARGVRATWPTLGRRRRWPVDNPEAQRWHEEDNTNYLTASGRSAQLAHIILMALHAGRGPNVRLTRIQHIWATGEISSEPFLREVGGVYAKTQQFIKHADHQDSCSVLLIPASNNEDLPLDKITRRDFTSSGRCFEPADKPLVISIERDELPVLLDLLSPQSTRRSLLYLAGFVLSLLMLTYITWSFVDSLTGFDHTDNFDTRNHKGVSKTPFLSSSPEPQSHNQTNSVIPKFLARSTNAEEQVLIYEPEHTAQTLPRKAFPSHPKRPLPPRTLDVVVTWLGTGIDDPSSIDLRVDGQSKKCSFRPRRGGMKQTHCLLKVGGGPVHLSAHAEPRFEAQAKVLPGKTRVYLSLEKKTESMKGE